jgi:hypothetical protein
MTWSSHAYWEIWYVVCKDGDRCRRYCWQAWHVFPVQAAVAVQDHLVEAWCMSPESTIYMCHAMAHSLVWRSVIITHRAYMN